MRIYHEQKYIENSKALFLKLLILSEQRLIFQSLSVCILLSFTKIYLYNLQSTLLIVNLASWQTYVVITNQYKYWHNLRVSLTLHHSTNVSPVNRLQYHFMMGTGASESSWS